MAAVRCPACGGSQIRELAGVGPVPVLCGSIWATSADAMATPAAELRLNGCDDCVHVWNEGFDPDLVAYDAQYDNSLDFSATFRGYAEGLVERLVRTFGLRGRRIVEIGSGDGEFLRRLCAAGGSNGVGFDPTYTGPERVGNITFVRAFFAPETSVGDVDFVCCRHVLEHLEDPHGFLCDVRAAVGGRPVPMYFEVPNADFNFGESGPWDLIYPHVAYFSASSLRAVLERAGYRVLRLEPEFDGQFLGAEVEPAITSGSSSSSESDAGLVASEGRGSALARQLSRTEEWRTRLVGMTSEGAVALWGAGSKGVTFLSLVDADHRISAVIDANPRKWGKFLPGTGHEVVAPDEVAQLRIGTVLVMNSAYVEEIGRHLFDLGVSAKVLVP